MKREENNNTSFFENILLFIGIDVHKLKWVVTIRTYDLELKTFSMKPSAEELERFLIKNYPGADYRIVYECCFSGFWIYDYFSEKGYKIIVTPTNRIYKDGSTIKTDKIDSRKLALQLSREMLKEVVVPAKRIREYKYIVEQIKDSEKIIERIKEDEELGRRIQILEKINGIGIISAVRMCLYLFDRKDKFESSERLNHYLGLTPSERSSGDKITRGRSGMCGNRQLRSIIIQLAWMTVRKDGALLDKFDRVYKKSGSKQKAIVAVARKLMTKIYAAIPKE